MGKKISKSPAAYRIIQVPMDVRLLGEVDAAAGRGAESRAAYIRGACAHRLRDEETQALDRRYVEGYRRTPEKKHWGQLGARLLAQRLRGDRW